MIEEVVLTKAQLEEMIDHCLRERPNEACGLLAAKDGAVVRVFPMDNAAASPVRYSLEPRQQFEMDQRFRAEDWDLGGVFHSHTHTDAYPSPTDVRDATEVVPYIIVSLAIDPPTTRAFLIIKANWTDSEGEIREIPVVVTDVPTIAPGDT
jgi:[CysO sulfur-carrier protein]-S-L-cysteine hydrolase